MSTGADDNDCPCCKRRNFEYLAGSFSSATTTLCGRNAVQISPSERGSVDFADIARRVSGVAKSDYNKFMLRFNVENLSITVFADGRAIIKGTNHPDVARTAYAKYVGH